jgi:hypothetical protein
MAFASKPAVSVREYDLVAALVRAGATPKKGVLKRGELSTHAPALYQSLRSKGILATETEGHGRGAKTMVRLLLEPAELEFSKRGAKPLAPAAATTSRKPTLEQMMALCELIVREERLAAAAAAPEPELLRKLDSIKAAFTAAIAANDVARMVELGKNVADVQKSLERDAGSFDARAKAFERIERNPEHAALAPFLRFLSPKHAG